MNYEKIVKSLMYGEKIFNLPLRVCYYARVSTESSVQLNSLDNQLNYYENYIKSNPNWIYIDSYIEEGKTGVNVEKRPIFKKMINDAKNNKFDLIITKEVSRFARDLEDSIHYIRKLKNYGVGVYFENQNITTFDSNSELILNIMFNLAQEESKKLSSRIKFGHNQAIKKGHVLGSSNITGYKKDNCKLVIVEEEAKFIKKLFELYATGQYGLLKLSKKLSELGYLNKNDKLYDKDSLKRMLENPKYKGYYRAKRYEIVDYRTKKRKKNTLHEQIIYKCKDDSIPAIVSEELWNKANLILETRTKKYKTNNNSSGGLKYPLSSKIYCHEHNKPFQRSNNSKTKTKQIWCCSMYLKYRLSSCISPLIREEILYDILKRIMQKLIVNKDQIINNILTLYKEVNPKNNYNKDIKSIDKSINNIEDKKTKLLELLYKENINIDYFKNQLMSYEEDIQKLNSMKNIIINNQSKYQNADLSIMIKQELDGELLNQFIRKFVNKIIVSKINNNRYNINLQIYLNIFNQNKIYLKDQKYSKISPKNKYQFTYNVYL